VSGRTNSSDFVLSGCVAATSEMSVQDLVRGRRLTVGAQKAGRIGSKFGPLPCAARRRDCWGLEPWVGGHRGWVLRSLAPERATRPPVGWTTTALRQIGRKIGRNCSGDGTRQDPSTMMSEGMFALPFTVAPVDATLWFLR